MSKKKRDECPSSPRSDEKKTMDSCFFFKTVKRRNSSCIKKEGGGGLEPAYRLEFSSFDEPNLGDLPKKKKQDPSVSPLLPVVMNIRRAEADLN